ncbi:MAG: EamA family transporter RarD [Endomicrobium sp.]|nr:EamA family transporter RarD [Endomicrobium sp.]
MQKFSSASKGVIYALCAYILWGIIPFYWKMLSNVNSVHILTARVVFAFVIMAPLLIIQKNLRWILCFKNKKVAVKVIALAVLITGNWGIYIWAVNSGHIIEASLGYFINPIFSIVLGVLFLREKMNALQKTAFWLAAFGIVLITIFSGKPPFISLSLALSFAFYGLIKKNVRLNALESLTAETFIAVPIAFVLLFIPKQGITYLFDLQLYEYILLFLAGGVTALPLFLFAKSAKYLPLSALGFIQFISPLLQFLFGIFIFREHFPTQNIIAVAFIWAGAVLYPFSYIKFKKKKAGGINNYLA